MSVGEIEIILDNLSKETYYMVTFNLLRFIIFDSIFLSTIIKVSSQFFLTDRRSQVNTPTNFSDSRFKNPIFPVTRSKTWISNQLWQV